MPDGASCLVSASYLLSDSRSWQQAIEGHGTQRHRDSMRLRHARPYPRCMSEQPNLAAVAVEVERAEAAASLSAMTFACELESLAAGAARTWLFYLASKVGLSADATRTVLDEYELRAKLLHEAHLVLRNLIAQQGYSASGRAPLT